MQNPLTLREMIAYRPLLFAWIWEVLCVSAALLVALTNFNSMVFIGLCLAGAAPFAIAFLMFMRARKAGHLVQRKRGGIVQ